MRWFAVLQALAVEPTLAERVAVLEVKVNYLITAVNSLDNRMWAVLILVIGQLCAYIIALKKKGEHHG